MVGRTHDVPGVPPSVDVPPPRQCLVAHPQPAAPRTFCHLGAIRRGARIVIDRRRMGVAAYQHKVRAKCLHDVELAFGTFEVPGTR
jgi:hypothetical protein